MRRALTRLLLGCLGICLALASAEGALRVLPLPDLRVLSTFQGPKDDAWIRPARPPKNAFRANPTLGTEHAPRVDGPAALPGQAGESYHFRTNNLGLRRDADTPVQKASDLVRVLVLGDSQADGFVENADSFSTLLEGRLAGRSGGQAGRVEVLNAGVGGYSPAQEYLWYQVHGAELRPDLVVVVFYVGNDIVELLDPDRPNVDPATGRTTRPGANAARAEGPLEGLRLVQLARYAVQVGPLADLWQRLALPGRLTEAGGYPFETIVQVFRICDGCYFQSLMQAARAHHDPQAMREAIDRAAGILILLDGEVRAAGGRLAVAVLPSRRQVEPERAGADGQRALIGLLGLGEADLAFEDEVEGAIIDRLGAAGVPTMPLREPLRRAAAEGPLYYDRDWHLNPLGHRAVAAALEQGLSELALVPGR